MSDISFSRFEQSRSGTSQSTSNAPEQIADSGLIYQYAKFVRENPLTSTLTGDSGNTTNALAAGNLLTY